MKNLSLGFALALWVAPFCFADKPTKIIIKGSDTLGAKMIPQLAEVYKAEGHHVSFEIAAEGSSSAFNTLIDQRCDIGMASRDIKPSELKRYQEKGLTITPHICAYDMIAVIVNAKNPIKSLTRKQVEQIFTGEITTWDRLGHRGPIRLYIRNTSSGTYKTFQKLAMNKRAYGKNAQKTGG